MDRSAIPSEEGEETVTEGELSAAAEEEYRIGVRVLRENETEDLTETEFDGDSFPMIREDGSSRCVRSVVTVVKIEAAAIVVAWEVSKKP